MLICTNLPFPRYLPTYPLGIPKTRRNLTTPYTANRTLVVCKICGLALCISSRLPGPGARNLTQPNEFLDMDFSMVVRAGESGMELKSSTSMRRGSIARCTAFTRIVSWCTSRLGYLLAKNNTMTYSCYNIAEFLCKCQLNGCSALFSVFIDVGSGPVASTRRLHHGSDSPPVSPEHRELSRPLHSRSASAAGHECDHHERASCQSYHIQRLWSDLASNSFIPRSKPIRSVPTTYRHIPTTNSTSNTLHLRRPRPRLSPVHPEQARPGSQTHHQPESFRTMAEHLGMAQRPAGLVHAARHRHFGRFR